MESEILEKRFGGIDLMPEYAGLKRAKAVILQCPYEETVTYGKGTKYGPGAILDASNHMELFDEELKTEIFKIGIYTNPPLELENLSPDDMVNQVKTAVGEVLKAEKLPVVLGGEHSISAGAVEAVSKYYNNLSVLYLDAHHDLRNEYKGSRYNHACAARRILEFCPLVEAGTRSLSKEEQDFLNTSPPNLKVVNVYDILETAQWKEIIVKSLSENVYISLDLDVFDPSIMPSVGTPEPGGFGWYELLDLLKAVTKNKKVAGFDIVELSPSEHSVAPDFLAARLIYRLLGYIFYKEKLT